MELRGVSRVALPLVSVHMSTELHAWVMEMWGSLLLNVVWNVVGVRHTQHQPPTQGGKAGDRGIRDRGALHTAGRRLRG